jgi:DNA polymerase-3 subunit epsilon
MPRILLIIDTETTGLQQGVDSLLEVGAILFSVEWRAPIQSLSFLLPVDRNPAEGINCIPAGLTRGPWPLSTCLEQLAQLFGVADAIVAHNAAFDRPWVESLMGGSSGKPWICSMEDMEWEGMIKARPSMVDLALGHGVPVWAAHRALTDCTYLSQVLERVDDLEGMLVIAMEPREVYVARVSYERRELAKQHGFHWDAGQRLWLKKMRAAQAECLPFQVSLLADVPEEVEV